MRSVELFRLDRTLTLLSSAACKHGPTRRRRSASIPILMYHSVSDDLDRSARPYFRTVTAPTTFATQIGAMRARGLRGITLGEALSALHANELGALEGKVVITFDDGLRDLLDNAVPVLLHAGFAATVFVVSDYIGARFVTGRMCLDALEMRALAGEGIEFGSHSASHRRLVELPDDELASELHSSRRSIEDTLGRSVDLFSYPYRFPEENVAFIPRLRALMLEAGYRGGVTTAIGTASSDDEPLFLPRLPVNDCDDSRLLLAKLDGHYDWLRVAQRLRKRYRAALASPMNR